MLNLKLFVMIIKRSFCYSLDCPSVDLFRFCQPRGEWSTEKVSIKGVVSRKPVLTVIEPKCDPELKCSHFALSNLIDSGYPLRDIKLDFSQFKQANILEHSLSKLDEYVKRSSVSVESKNV